MLAGLCGTLLQSSVLAWKFFHVIVLILREKVVIEAVPCFNLLMDVIAVSLLH
jgi:hypothetical protein